MTGTLFLAPAALTATSGPSLMSLAAAAWGGSSSLPGAGDLLAALQRADTSPEDYGVGGELPEADTLSAELISALAGPSAAESGGFDSGSGALASVSGALGIPGTVLQAYLDAEARLAATTPRCNMPWHLLAGVGRIESNHARGGAVDGRGTTVRPILGPQLAGGPGVAAIPDSDDGALDGDTAWDRAVGPMQFIPTTWAAFGRDGNADGRADPHNVFDAALAAGAYLCSGGEDMTDPVQMARAIFRYNHSEAYVRNVLSWANAYALGVTPLPSGPGDLDDPGFDFPGPDPGGPGTPAPGAPGTTTPGAPAATTTTPPPAGTTTTTPSPTPTTPSCAPPTTTTTPSTSTSETTTPPPPTTDPNCPQPTTTTPAPSGTTTEVPVTTTGVGSVPDATTTRTSTADATTPASVPDSTTPDATTPDATTPNATTADTTADATTSDASEQPSPAPSSSALPTF